MSVFLSPIGNGQQFFTDAGLPLNQGLIYTYQAGTLIAQATYTTSSGLAQNSNPITLGVDGRPPNEIWLTGGVSYLFILKDSLFNVLDSWDNLSGINDTTTSAIDQWQSSNLTPTYVSATSFTLTGNQTTNFSVGRALKTVNTGGTVYSLISTSSYNGGTGLTTIVVTNVSGTLDAGLSSVAYGLITSINTSLPAIAARSGANSDITSLTGLTTPLSIPQDFRLTLTTAVPVTTTDVTGATTIYCTPYRGNKISLYTGTYWVTRTSAQFSLALGTLTSGKAYDVFCYDNAGTPTLEFLVWTNDTTRATALAYQDGVLVKSGDATRRYLGTFYTTATTTTEDSKANRYLFNYYNRVARTMSVTDSTASWTYTTDAFRQARGSTANQLNLLIGVSEDAVTAKVQACSSDTAARNKASGIGLDSTTVNSAALYGGSCPPAGQITITTADYCSTIAVGRHYLTWLEKSATGGAATWYGLLADGYCSSGIQGIIYG